MRSLITGFVGLLVGAFAAAVIVFLLMGTTRRSNVTAPVPQLGGQPVPEEVIEINFDRRYDVHTSIYGVEPLTFLDSKIVGFTGRRGESNQVEAGMFASSSGSSYRNHFDHWLVLEQADGRLLYLPPDSVKYVEQAAPKGKVLGQVEQK